MASEYLKWKYRDVRPDEVRELTPKEKRANWWYYHKWHIGIGAVLLLAVGSICYSALGIGKVKPDYQVAYVGNYSLPDDTVAALEEALASLGEDANGDGKVTVRLNQYASNSAEGEGDSEAAMYAYAASTTLMADLTSRDSYFFLLENPSEFQKNYQVLRRLDGTLPTDLDMDYDSCYVPWTDCPVLRDLDLGNYEESFAGETGYGSNQDLFQNLWVARRGFWNDKTSLYPEACDRLWASMTKGAF